MRPCAGRLPELLPARAVEPPREAGRELLVFLLPDARGRGFDAVVELVVRAGEVARLAMITD